ncbi:MAG: serine/threonine-protein kinase [Gemmatimonadales bacterium]
MTDQDRWRQIEGLFQAASELALPERDAYLATATGDPSIRAEVEALLAASVEGDGFLRDPIQHELAHSAHKVAELGERVGRYHLIRQLGAGGMGLVYLARDDQGVDGTMVAIKFLRTDLGFADGERRFRAEQRILSGLRHPNIASLLDAGSTDRGIPYVVMEYVPGSPIDEYCESQWLTLEQRIDLMITVSEAVHYANERRVVHRDLKPGNVMVSRGGTPKLLDFGIAKLLDADGVGARTTRTGMVMLTPSYASPEQILGGDITAASDVYSLAVVSYELVTGKRPYTLALGTPVETALQMERLTPTTPTTHRPDLSPALERILLTGLAKHTAKRYPSAEAYARDLRRWRAGELGQ